MVFLLLYKITNILGHTVGHYFEFYEDTLTKIKEHKEKFYQFMKKLTFAKVPIMQI